MSTYRFGWGGGSQILGQSGRKMVAREGGNLHMGGRGLVEGEPVLEGGGTSNLNRPFLLQLKIAVTETVSCRSGTLFMDVLQSDNKVRSLSRAVVTESGLHILTECRRISTGKIIM